MFSQLNSGQSVQRGRKGISALPHPPGPNRGHPRWADTPPSSVPCLPLSFFFLSLMCLCIWCACLCVFVLGVHVSVCLCMCVLVYVCQESSLPSSLREAISVDSRAHSTANLAPRCAPEVLCCFLSAGVPAPARLFHQCWVSELRFSHLQDKGFACSPFHLTPFSVSSLERERG